MKTTVVVPWHNRNQLDAFIDAWKVSFSDERILFQQDRDKSGCALTKNAGIRRAINDGAETLIVLDDDCFPESGQTLDSFILDHNAALKPQPVEMFEAVTAPPSRSLSPRLCVPSIVVAQVSPISIHSESRSRRSTASTTGRSMEAG